MLNFATSWKWIEVCVDPCNSGKLRLVIKFYATSQINKQTNVFVHKSLCKVVQVMEAVFLIPAHFVRLLTGHWQTILIVIGKFWTQMKVSKIFLLIQCHVLKKY